MCPKYKDGICEVAGIEPEHVECVDENCCYKRAPEYERCRLYIAEFLISNNEDLLELYIKEVASYAMS